MVEIEYKGANGIIISTKKSRLAVDPKLSVVGLKDVSVKDSIELATEARFVTKSQDVKLIIEGPGEYEVADFSLKGIAAQRHIDTEADGKKATIYRIVVEDIAIGLLGNIDAKLNEDQLEELGVVDVLVVPVGGGGYTLDATSAAQLVRSIEAKVIIPVHYDDKAINYEVPQDTLEVFLGELGGDSETVDKYKIKSAASIPQAMTTVVVTRS